MKLLVGMEIMDRLTFIDYSATSKNTDQFKTDDDKSSIMYSLFSIKEEVDEIYRLALKEDLEGQLSDFFEEKVGKKLGNILWYTSSITNRLDFNFDKIAKKNLKRCEERWRTIDYDKDYDNIEILPKKFMIRFEELKDRNRKIITSLKVHHDIEWLQIGDRIDDNAHVSDDYRYHDILHISYVAYLGWSPVIRRMLSRKRKSNPDIDRIEDGARAANLEEALTAFVFEYAKRNDMFKGQEILDIKLLKAVERLVKSLEVHSAPPKQWEKAIIHGYKVLEQLIENKGGYCVVSRGEENGEPLIFHKDKPENY